MAEEPMQRLDWTREELRVRDSLMRGKAGTGAIPRKIWDIGLSACVLFLPPIAALAAVFATHLLQEIHPSHEEQASLNVPYYFSIADYPKLSIGKDLSRVSSAGTLSPDGVEELGSEPDRSGATLQPIVEGELFHAPRAVTSVGLASREVVRNKMRDAHKAAKPRLRIHRGTSSSV